MCLAFTGIWTTKGRFAQTRNSPEEQWKLHWWMLLSELHTLCHSLCARRITPRELLKAFLNWIQTEPFVWAATLLLPLKPSARAEVLLLILFISFLIKKRKFVNYANRRFHWASLGFIWLHWASLGYRRSVIWAIKRKLFNETSIINKRSRWAHWKVGEALEDSLNHQLLTGTSEGFFSSLVQRKTKDFSLDSRLWSPDSWTKTFSLKL